MWQLISETQGNRRVLTNRLIWICLKGIILNLLKKYSHYYILLIYTLKCNIYINIHIERAFSPTLRNITIRKQQGTSFQSIPWMRITIHIW